MDDYDMYLLVDNLYKGSIMCFERENERKEKRKIKIKS